MNIFQHLGKKRLGGFRPVGKPSPTRAQPGSKQKVEIMCERILRGEDLFHASDLSALPDILDMSWRDNDRRQKQLHKLWAGEI